MKKITSQNRTAEAVMTASVIVEKQMVRKAIHFIFLKFKR